MVFTRSNRVAIENTLTFHKDSDPQTYSLKYIYDNTSLKYVVARDTSYVNMKFDLDQELIDAYFCDSCVATDDISQYDRISLKKSYYDRLTGEELRREFVGSYVKSKKNPCVISMKDYIEYQMKTETRSYWLASYDSGHLRFFINYKNNHLDFREGW